MIKLIRRECPYPKALADRNYKHHLNKEALKASNNDKCMYCESIISHIDFAHIEHIKPKAADKFPELEFEWSNLGFACPRCNNEKSDKYDVDLPYLNPYEDDPTNHLFAACPIVMVKNGCERAESTINDVNLNRPELIEKRQERLKSIQKALNACNRTQSLNLRQLLMDELYKEADVDKEYSLCVKSLLEMHAA